MNLQITGRNLEITPALNDAVEKKLLKIKEYFPQIIDVQVILKVDNKTVHLAEITLNSEGKTFHCESRTNDMYDTLDKIFDKLETQIRRYKDKMARQNLRGQKQERMEIVKNETLTDTETGPLAPITKVRQIAPKPKTAHEAILQLSMNEFRFDIFHRGGDQNFAESIALKMDEGDYYFVIYPHDSKWIQKKVKLDDQDLVEIQSAFIEIKKMNLDEAIDVLNQIGQNGNSTDHLIYYDKEFNFLNILYFRKNKTMGLITSGEV